MRTARNLSEDLNLNAFIIVIWYIVIIYHPRTHEFCLETKFPLLKGAKLKGTQAVTGKTAWISIKTKSLVLEKQTA